MYIRTHDKEVLFVHFFLSLLFVCKFASILLAWLLRYGMPIPFINSIVEQEAFRFLRSKSARRLCNHLPQIPKKPLMQTFYPEAILPLHPICLSHALSRTYPESACVYLKRKAWTDFALWMDRGGVSLASDVRKTYRRVTGGKRFTSLQQETLVRGREPVFGRFGSRFRHFSLRC